MLGCGYTDGRLAPRSVSAMLDEFLEAAYEALKAIGAQRHCDSDRAYMIYPEDWSRFPEYGVTGKVDERKMRSFSFFIAYRRLKRE